jgi:hypothetical protein
MMHMTYAQSSGPWMAHIVFMIVALLFVVGTVLLIVWAAKSLTKKQLLWTGIGLLVGAVALCLIGWNRMHDGKMKHMNMDGNMRHQMEMMEDDMMSMTMNDMSEMLVGKTGDDFDRAFIEGMIPHHQGAIDMAREALKSAKHQEIKDMAEAIIGAQQSEIDMMNRWMVEWGYAAQVY